MFLRYTHVMNNTSKFPLILLGLYIVELIICSINPYDRAVWFAEIIPILTIVGVLIWLYIKKIRFSNLAHGMMAVLIFWHTVGAYYTFSRVPFETISNLLGGEGRNMYDRIGHFSVGFYAFAIAEWLSKTVLQKNRKLSVFLAIACIGLIASLYEVLEWQFAVIYGGDAGAAFLGSQGDIWDAQKDMALDIVGGIAAGILFLVIPKKKEKTSP
mgnify:FL=1